MPVTCYYPMAPSDCPPKIISRHRYLHGPPSSDPAEFMEALRQGLRSAKRRGFWGKLKSVGWHLLRGCYLLVNTNDVY
jgi:hypothetical protein